MALNMRNHVSGDLKSLTINRFTKSGQYVDGYWVEEIVPSGSFDANVQPLNSREIKDLGIGLERIGDIRIVHINNATQDISLRDQWEFLGEKWKTMDVDNRSFIGRNRNYCRLMLERIDNENT